MEITVKLIIGLGLSGLGIRAKGKWFLFLRSAAQQRRRAHDSIYNKHPILVHVFWMFLLVARMSALGAVSLTGFTPSGYRRRQSES